MAIFSIQSSFSSSFNDGHYNNNIAMGINNNNKMKTSTTTTTETETTATCTWPTISTFNDDDEQPENVWFFRHN